MEFLVEFEVEVPDGTPEAEVEQRTRAEAFAAARLVDEGHLLRLWRRTAGAAGSTAIGLYDADSRVELDAMLAALPLAGWLRLTIIPLAAHPNDPAPAPSTSHLPAPRLTPIYHLEAALGRSLDVGDVSHGHRRIVPLTGGTFTGRQLNGTLLPGASADWQIVLADGTALGDVRYTLETDGGGLLYVQSRGVRHASADVLARLGRGEDVDAGEYTFRTTTQIETAVPELDWLNKGIFISVGGRRPGGVSYDTYLVA